jgi:hypothetical protein
MMAASATCRRFGGSGTRAKYQAEAPCAQPAARALRDDTDAKYGDQQQYTEAEQDRRQAPQVIGADLGNQEQDAESHEQTQDMLEKRREVRGARAVHHQQADTGEGEQCIEQRDVDVPALQVLHVRSLEQKSGDRRCARMRQYDDYWSDLSSICIRRCIAGFP